jgi:hypothetical protein
MRYSESLRYSYEGLSRKYRVTTCTPTGSPPFVRPTGERAAAHHVILWVDGVGRGRSVIEPVMVVHPSMTGGILPCT